MDDPVRHERFVAVGKNGWTKKAIIRKTKTSSFSINFFYEWYKKIPYSLSIRLYLDQLINLNSIRKADKSKAFLCNFNKNIQRGDYL